MFQVDRALLEECRHTLGGDARIRWVLGGSGSGKSAVCREIHSTLGVPVLDMDARIYGTFHALFSPLRHPVSYAWSMAPDGLGWLLDMTPDEFDSFNRASLPEYLDLLAGEIRQIDDGSDLVIDGGVCNPTLLAEVIDPARMVCMRRDGLDPRNLWAEPGERLAMRDAVMRLDATGAKWSRFLEFDRGITSTLLAESSDAAVPVCGWDESEPVSAVATRVSALLGLVSSPFT